MGGIISITQMAITVAVLGVEAFVLALLAERRKPASGNTVISDNGVVTCKYPSDPSVFFGFTSIASLTACIIIAFYSLFYPYKGKSVPPKALFSTATMLVFFHIAVLVSISAEGMLLWATISELMHLTNNVHHNMNTKCSTAKTGLFGGAAFMSLNATLFWLLCLMLVDNARVDYFDDQQERENPKAEYAQALTTNYDPN